MENSIHSQTLCSQCDAEINLETKFCANCGFPENGTEKEQAIFHAKKAMKKNQVKDDQKKIKSARNTLYWLAGIFFVSGLFLFFTLQDTATLIVSAILAIIYLGLAYWSQKKPFAALLSALLLYITVIALNAIVEPVTLVKGILIKIIILSFLIKGVYSASQDAKD